MKIQFSPEIGKAKDAYLAARKSAALQINAARQEWNDLSIKQIDAATTKEQAMLAFRAAPWAMPAKMYAVDKLTEVCNTKEELLEAYKKTRGRRLWNNMHPALLKLQAIMRSEIDSATSVDEAETVYWSSLKIVNGAYGSEGVHEEAFKKWLSFCTTVEMLENLGRRMEGRLHHQNYRMYINRLEEITGEKHVPMCML